MPLAVVELDLVQAHDGGRLRVQAHAEADAASPQEEGEAVFAVRRGEADQLSGLLSRPHPGTESRWHRTSKEGTALIRAKGSERHLS